MADRKFKAFIDALSTRSRNVLHEYGITSLRALCARSGKQLLARPNCGRFTLREIEKGLRRLGLKLASYKKPKKPRPPSKAERERRLNVHYRTGYRILRRRLRLLRDLLHLDVENGHDTWLAAALQHHRNLASVLWQREETLRAIARMFPKGQYPTILNPAKTVEKHPLPAMVPGMVQALIRENEQLKAVVGEAAALIPTTRD